MNKRTAVRITQSGNAGYIDGTQVVSVTTAGGITPAPQSLVKFAGNSTGILVDGTPDDVLALLSK